MRHPWLQSLAPVAGLVDHARVWTFLAAHTACGDLEGVERDWRHLHSEHHRGGLEAVLQTLLFAGFPRTLNALGVMQRIGITAPVDDAEPPGDWLAAGEALCGQIYGAGYARLRDNIAALHPAVDRWMIEMGYGRVLSRAGLSVGERELCAIAVLAGIDVPVQLESHLRGALRVGVPAAVCAAVVDHTERIWGAEPGRVAAAVWERVLS
jgi:4-carboxymuconolactone decarboxylase